jgi:hypothetical protein
MVGGKKSTADDGNFFAGIFSGISQVIFKRDAIIHNHAVFRKMILAIHPTFPIRTRPSSPVINRGEGFLEQESWYGNFGQRGASADKPCTPGEP